MKSVVGRYKGIEYKQQRICDVMVSNDRACWFFTYRNGSPTGDSYSTIVEMKKHIDQQHLQEGTPQ